MVNLQIYFVMLYWKHCVLLVLKLHPKKYAYSGSCHDAEASATSSTIATIYYILTEKEVNCGLPVVLRSKRLAVGYY